VSQCKYKTRLCKKCKGLGHHYVICPKVKTGTFLQTFVCAVRYRNINISCRGILDRGSDISYVTNRLVKRLKATVVHSLILNVELFGASDSRRTGTVVVHLRGENRKEKECTFYTTEEIVKGTQFSPPPEIVRSMLPQGRQYADPGLFHPMQQPIDLLIGSDFLYTFMYDNIQRLTGNLVLLQSHFGWIPAGSVGIESQVDQGLPALLSAVDLKPTKDKEPVHWELDESQEIRTLWSLEAMGIRKEELEVSDI